MNQQSITKSIEFRIVNKNFTCWYTPVEISKENNRT